MTERKPAGISFETWVDRQVRVAQERGDFDNLPGAGKPLPGRSHDELGWVRDYVRREGLSSEALLPTPLRLRREIERLAETIRGLHSEHAVRAVAEELNVQIVDYVRMPSGPRVPIGPVNADDLVEKWRAMRRWAKRRRTSRRPGGPGGGAGSSAECPAVEPIGSRRDAAFAGRSRRGLWLGGRAP